MDYCDKHMEMVVSVTRIIERIDSLDQKVSMTNANMEKHIEQGEKWRLAIVGVIFAIFCQIGTFLYLWGGLIKQVQINTDRWAAHDTYKEIK